MTSSELETERRKVEGSKQYILQRLTMSHDIIGARAAQVVPHVHFHIIPRLGDVPEVKAQSWTVFGRGQRGELDDEEATELVRTIRERLLGELEGIRRREGDRVVNAMFGEATEDNWERRWSKL